MAKSAPWLSVRRQFHAQDRSFLYVFRDVLALDFFDGKPATSENSTNR
jgi:hypothetical protein